VNFPDPMPAAAEDRATRGARHLGVRFRSSGAVGFPKSARTVPAWQRQQQDADGLRAYDLRLDVSGHSEVHLCIGDDGDGNKGTSRWSRQLQIINARNTSRIPTSCAPA